MPCPLPRLVGKEHARHFARKVDGQRWLDEVTASVVTGAYVDPGSNAVTVGAYSPSWLTGKVPLKPKARASYESLLRTRVLPQWRDVPLGRVTYEAVTVWVASMASGLARSRPGRCTTC